MRIPTARPDSEILLIGLGGYPPLSDACLISATCLYDAVGDPPVLGCNKTTIVFYSISITVAILVAGRPPHFP